MLIFRLRKLGKIIFSNKYLINKKPDWGNPAKTQLEEKFFLNVGLEIVEEREVGRIGGKRLHYVGQGRFGERLRVLAVADV